MLEPRQKSIKLIERKNYGSSLRPLYTIAVRIEIVVKESPDMLHKLFTGTGLIARDTVPFDVVSNFRGSVENKPYYYALLVHEGNSKKYVVQAKDTGRSLRTGINYEPVIYPEELRLIHPAEFYRRDIEVKEWELHNYRHYFMAFIASKRYESFDMAVKREEKVTRLRVKITESELREKKVPCSWYLKRLSVFKDMDLEDEVMKEIKRYENE